MSDPLSSGRLKQLLMMPISSELGPQTGGFSLYGLIVQPYVPESMSLPIGLINHNRAPAGLLGNAPTLLMYSDPQ